MKAIRQQALKFLSRREYSRYELQRKLLNKGWDINQVNSALDDLAVDKLQDDMRFIAAYIHSRSSAGYGPRRILSELAERGVKSIPLELADENNMKWLLILKQTWEKKFNQSPQNLADKAKQSRFLIYRGFTPEQVYGFLKEVERRFL